MDARHWEACTNVLNALARYRGSVKDEELIEVSSAYYSFTIIINFKGTYNDYHWLIEQLFYREYDIELISIYCVFVV